MMCAGDSDISLNVLVMRGSTVEHLRYYNVGRETLLVRDGQHDAVSLHDVPMIAKPFNLFTVKAIR